LSPRADRDAIHELVGRCLPLLNLFLLVDHPLSRPRPRSTTSALRLKKDPSAPHTPQSSRFPTPSPPLPPPPFRRFKFLMFSPPTSYTQKFLSRQRAVPLSAMPTPPLLPPGPHARPFLETECPVDSDGSPFSQCAICFSFPFCLCVPFSGRLAFLFALFSFPPSFRWETSSL